MLFYVCVQFSLFLVSTYGSKLAHFFLTQASFTKPYDLQIHSYSYKWNNVIYIIFYPCICELESKNSLIWYHEHCTNKHGCVTISLMVDLHSFRNMPNCEKHSFKVLFAFLSLSSSFFVCVFRNTSHYFHWWLH
jgi:hypothetical protein